MLYRSGENLFEGAKSFVDQNEEITVFSAYLKLDTLKKLNESRTYKTDNRSLGRLKIYV